MTDDLDPVASWNDRIASLRKRGRVSADAALTVVPTGEIDVRRGRPPVPERLSEQPERELWTRLTHSRRPGWFAGAEELLESYVLTVMQVRQIEAALRKTMPDTSDAYSKLALMHRQATTLATTLAVKLRLTPSARIDKRLPPDGDLPIIA